MKTIVEKQMNNKQQHFSRYEKTEIQKSSPVNGTETLAETDPIIQGGKKPSDIQKKISWLILYIFSGMFLY